MNANLMTKKIEMSKSEAKAAGKLNSDQFNELRQLMEMYPGYEIQIKAPAKRKVEFKGLTYEYMAKYIKNCNREDKQAVLAEFNTLIAQDKKSGVEGAEHLEATGYQEVKKWFLGKFPEIKQYKENHENKVREILSAA